MHVSIILTFTHTNCLVPRFGHTLFHFTRGAPRSNSIRCLQKRNRSWTFAVGISAHRKVFQRKCEADGRSQWRFRDCSGKTASIHFGFHHSYAKQRY